MLNNFFPTNVRTGLLLVLVLVSLLGCDTQPLAEAPDTAPEVAVVTVNAQDLPIQTELAGRVAALRVADVRPQVRGIIEKRLFVEGADVKAGDVLFQINDANYAAAVEQAQANVAVAQAGLLNLRLIAQRYEKLSSASNISRHELEVAQANYQQGLAQMAVSEAQLKIAQIDLQRTRICAPIAGRIGRSLVSEGALVASEQESALAKIQQLDPIYVDIVQSSQQLTQFKVRKLNPIQSHVSLLLEGGHAYSHTGTLEFTDINVDAESGMVTLRAQFPNPDGLLLPGMFVRTQVAQGIEEQVVLVPQQAVSYNEKSQPVAWVVNERQEAHLRVLQLLGNQGNHWIVRSGLNSGERVIVEGSLRVRPGLKVTAVAWAGQDVSALVQSDSSANTQEP